MDPLKIPPLQQESKLHFLDYWRIIRIRKTVIIAVFLLVVMTATLVTFILPEAYVSTARIKVEKDQAYDIAPLTEQRAVNTYDPYFIQTEFEVIRSQMILHKVIERLDLNTRWGKKYAGGDKLKTSESYMLLLRQLDLRPTRNTSLIEIRVYSEDKNEAAELANAIAEEYRDFRLAKLNELRRGGINALTEEFAAHEKKVRAAQEELDRLRRELNITDQEAVSTGPAPIYELNVLRQMDALRVERETQYVAEEKLLNQLKGLSREQLKEVIPTAAPDPLLQGFLTDLAQAESRLVALSKDFGDANPEVQRVRALVEDLNQKVNSRIDGILAGLEARVNVHKTYVEKLKADVEEAKRLDRERAEQTRPYWDKKRELEQLLRLGQTLQMKIALESYDSQLPKQGMVMIVDRAEPGLRPVKPNKPLNITLGIIIGLVVGVGLAFFIEYLDTSVKTIDDVERALQSPVLGVIPQNVGLLPDEGDESPHAEAYRVLRTNLLFSRKDEKLNTLCIVSAGAGEGKSTTALNLATVFAQAGQRILLVDSDLRRPALHKFLRVGNTLGLTSYLLKQNSLEEVIQTTRVPNLDFMASGKLPSSSLGILSSARMKDLINELKQRYDFVFFDSPPIMGVSDASILASEVDMTLQVIQYRRYPQPMNIRAKQVIEKVGGNLVGIVLNNINMSQDESYYYYSGYYFDYYSRNEPEAEPVAAAEGAPSGDASRGEKLNLKKKY